MATRRRPSSSAGARSATATARSARPRRIQTLAQAPGPARSAAEAIELANRYGANNYKPLPVVIERGEGAWVWDMDGKRYLDMLAAYSALIHGHRHPRVVAALVEQAGRVTLTSRAYHVDVLGPFLRDLAEATGFAKSLLMNTGAEAVETAIKAARKWGHTVKGVPADRGEILVCEGNFHGRTTTIVGFSSEEKYREGFGPFTPGFRRIPYGDLDALRAAIGPETIAFLVEPIQGEAGVVIPPEGYLREARRLCTENRVLLVADEVQTGFGRTGKWFAWQHEDARPDILVVGKALGGGVYPVSAICADDPVMGIFRPGDHGSTFGGNPLAAAVGRAALLVLRDEKLVERSATEGAWFLGELRRALAGSPHVREVRGRGLFVGIEIRKESGTARAYAEKLMAAGLLTKDTHDQVLRFAPPLTISRKDLGWAVERVAGALA
ncbi:MAG: ornithine--oxo-acid transaminase [Planctomycetales bacterium]|nr:ornithine--oxo-acid transaminase [Planctomycetales bacterium]